MGTVGATPGLATDHSAKVMKALSNYVVGTAFGRDNASASCAVLRLGAAIPKTDGARIDPTLELRFKLGMRTTGLFPGVVGALWRIVESGILAEQEEARAKAAAASRGSAPGPHTKFWNESFNTRV